MKIALLIASTLLISSVAGLSACSSSTPANDASSENYPAPTILKETKPTSPAKPFKPAKAIKCTYDTDCVVQDACASGTCKISGNACRFRSDCPSPRGTCVNKKCEF